MAAFRANGIITLTTDFGAREPFVGIMKGVMLGHAPHLRFIDMAHEVSAFQPVEAGFWLAHALRYFPAGTLHVAVVDPGVGTPRALLVAFSGEQALLAPDNGLLAPLAARGNIDRVIQVDLSRLVKFGVSDVSATFHGRDVFAPLAAAIAAGRCNPADLGPEITTFSQVGWPPTTPRKDGGFAGVIVAVDRFGNLISNIESTAVVALTLPTVHIGGLALPLKRTYGDAKPGEYLGVINSFDVLEVAQSRGNAAAGLKLAVGAPISVVPGVPDPQFRRS
jgi:S-adenosylmethionine hydrolase